MSKNNKWKYHGVKVISKDKLDDKTPQTKGMKRYAAITKNIGALKIWAGKVDIEPDAKTGAHHHGELECNIRFIRQGKNEVGE